MSCGCNNNGNGWGGCGCGGTVQYAPAACNPNFPTACQALGAGTIQRVVGEDSAYCKYTVPTLASNSILFYNSSTALISWGNGTVANPIFLGNGSGQATASSSVQLQATTPTGQLVAFNPSTSTEAQFPFVTPSGSTTNWGTIENIVANQGLVYKTGNVPPSGNYIPTSSPYVANTVYQLSTSTTTVSNASTVTNVVSFDSNGNAIIVPASSLNTTTAFIDANAISIYPSSVSGTTNLSVKFGQLVVTNPSNNAQTIINASGTIYNLNILTAGAGGIDSGSAIANTVYFIYVIYGTGAGINVLLSSSGTSPTLPGGYSYARLIGITKTTNSAATIDSYYNQNGRILNLGYTARQIVLSYGYPNITNNYFTGQITQYISSAYVNTATMKLTYLRYPGTSYDFSSVVVGNTSAGTTGTTFTAYPQTAEIYGSANTMPIATEGAGGYSTPNYITFTTFVPQNSVNSYYNVFTYVAPAYAGDIVELAITGYELNIF